MLILYIHYVELLNVNLSYRLNVIIILFIFIILHANINTQLYL